MKQTPRSQKPDRLDGVFSGGGSLGIAYVGALRAVQDHGLWFSRTAGTSAGAMTAALIAAGYDAAELEWLLAPEDAGIKRPASLPPSITEPVDLSSFLDFPQSWRDLGTATMRETFLWKAIKLNAVDEVLSRKLTRLPTRVRLVDRLTDRIVALSLRRLDKRRNRIRSILNAALRFYPDDTPEVGNFLPTPLEPVRRQIADAAWKAFTDTVREYRLLVNWTFQGGLFEGRVLYETIGSLLEAKVSQSRGLPVRPVRFRDLPLGLALVSVNTSNADIAKRMQVRTKRTARNMEVAQAVRDSMSIPLFFEPRICRRGGSTSEIMDGGVASNFPFWVFTGGHGTYLRPSQADNRRPKLGFILDKDLDGPLEWACPAPKWHVPDSRLGQSPSNTEALAENPEFEFLSRGGPFGEFIAVERVLRVIDVFLSSELPLTEPWRSSIKAAYPYHEVQIPLKGYHPLDFSIARDVDAWRGMVDRGYEATVETLLDAGLVEGTARRRNPYRSQGQRR